jgi:hypothetical protein
MIPSIDIAVVERYENAVIEKTTAISLPYLAKQMFP